MTPQHYKLQDVIINGSCCRKGGDVELVDTIPPGRTPSPDTIRLVYNPEKKAKAFAWACKPFKGTRLVLKYAGTDEHFFLDGKFSTFLQTEATETEATPYHPELPILTGQVWEADSPTGRYRLLIRSEGLGPTVFLSYQEEVEGEIAWIASEHSIPKTAVRSTLANGHGVLVAAV